MRCQKAEISWKGKLGMPFAISVQSLSEDVQTLLLRTLERCNHLASSGLVPRWPRGLGTLLPWLVILLGPCLHILESNYLQ